MKLMKPINIKGLKTPALFSIFSIFNVENRIKIMFLLKKEKELNITQISKGIGCAYNNTLAHLKKLEKENFIQTKKMKKKRGQEVFVCLSEEIKDSKTFFEVLGELKKGL